MWGVFQEKSAMSSKQIASRINNSCVLPQAPQTLSCAHPQERSLSLSTAAQPQFAFSAVFAAAF